MKIRSGFVSNSSSSSFVVLKENMTEKQIYQMQNIAETMAELLEEKNKYSERYFLEEFRKEDLEYWNLNEDKISFSGNTYMDNFSMDTFLDIIGVKKYESRE